MACYRRDSCGDIIIKIKSPAGNLYLGFTIESVGECRGDLVRVDLDRHKCLLLIAESLSATKLVNERSLNRGPSLKGHYVRQHKLLGDVA